MPTISLPLPSFWDLPHLGGNATASPLLPFHYQHVGSTTVPTESGSLPVVTSSVGSAIASPSPLASCEPRVVEVNTWTSNPLYRKRREGKVLF
jgi:hypothetical protein